MINGTDLYGDLPMFPTIYDPISEHRLECIVEKLTDRADQRYLAGKATAEQYTAWQRALNDWATLQPVHPAANY